MRGLRRGLRGTLRVGYVEGYVGGGVSWGGGGGGLSWGRGGVVVDMKSWSKMVFLGTFWKITTYWSPLDDRE